MIGRVINNYEIRAPLGEGGMGTVWLAEHAFIGRKAAIKVLRRMWCDDADMVARFLNEARAVGAIGHANIIDIIDVGHLEDGLPYLMMEHLEGETLAKRLQRPPRLALAEVLMIVKQAAAALAAAHTAGIIHRDLKPENVFLSSDAFGRTRVKLLDFGIAKLHDVTGAKPVDTTSGLLGTPTYMSPEQCRGGNVAVDARTDVYALGILLYQMVCGEVPFAGAAAGEVLVMQILQAPRPPRELAPDLPAWMEAIVLRMLAKDPAERFVDMDALSAALDDGLQAAAQRVAEPPASLAASEANVAGATNSSNEAPAAAGPDRANPAPTPTAIPAASTGPAPIDPSEDATPVPDGTSKSGSITLAGIGSPGAISTGTSRLASSGPAVSNRATSGASESGSTASGSRSNSPKASSSGPSGATESGSGAHGSGATIAAATGSARRAGADGSDVTTAASRPGARARKRQTVESGRGTAPVAPPAFPDGSAQQPTAASGEVRQGLEPVRGGSTMATSQATAASGSLQKDPIVGSGNVGATKATTPHPSIIVSSATIGGTTSSEATQAFRWPSPVPNGADSVPIPPVPGWIVTPITSDLRSPSRPPLEGLLTRPRRQLALPLLATAALGLIVMLATALRRDGEPAPGPTLPPLVAAARSAATDRIPSATSPAAAVERHRTNTAVDRARPPAERRRGKRPTFADNRPFPGQAIPTAAPAAFDPASRPQATQPPTSDPPRSLPSAGSRPTAPLSAGSPSAAPAVGASPTSQSSAATPSAPSSPSRSTSAPPSSEPSVSRPPASPPTPQAALGAQPTLVPPTQATTAGTPMPEATQPPRRSPRRRHRPAPPTPSLPMDKW